MGQGVDVHELRFLSWTTQAPSQVESRGSATSSAVVFVCRRIPERRPEAVQRGRHLVVLGTFGNVDVALDLPRA